MGRRIFAIVLIVLGLGTIGAAIASGTIWRPDDRVTLTLPATPDVPLVITAPGVLNAVNNEVDVRLVGASADSPIVLAMGHESDVRAWVGEAAHWEITGLADWETLTYLDPREDAATPTEGGSQSASEAGSEGASSEASTEASADPTEEAATPAEGESTAESEPEPEETVPNPSGSDLWVEQVTGTGELDYNWTAIPGRWVMLAASDGTAPAPQIELTWAREVTTPFVQPGIILGSVLTVIGLGLLAMQLLIDRERHGARRAAASAAPSDAVRDTHTIPIPVATVGADGRPLTRREIRLAEAARGRAGAAAPKEEGTTPESAAPGADSGDAMTESVPAITPGDAEPQSAALSSGYSLDEWIRTGAASPQLHEGERSTPNLTPDDEPAAETHAAEQVSDETGLADDASAEDEGPWWRRRRYRRVSEADRESVDRESAVSPEEVPLEAESSEEELPKEPTIAEPADGEDSPQASGASWRQTWGLGATDESDQSDEGERR